MQFRTEYQLKSKLLNRFEALVRELYDTRDTGGISEEWSRRDNHLSGFIDAIAVSELIEMDVLQATIDRIHLEIFGESRVERRQRMQKLRQSAAEMDWKRLDTPAFERKKPRRR